MKFILALVFCLASVGSAANHPAPEPYSNKAKPIVLSYTQHPILEQTTLPILTEAYRNIGYEPSFINISSDRFIKLSAQHMIDGDVARVSQVLELAPNMIKAYHYGNILLSLHCQPKIECSEATLHNPKNTVFISSNMQIFQILSLNYKAKKYLVKDWSILTQLFKQGKVQRFLWISAPWLTSDTLPETNSVVIETEPLELFHVLHQSKAELIPLINSELARLMAERKQKTEKEFEGKTLRFHGGMNKL